jgi:hypothetical protein
MYFEPDLGSDAGALDQLGEAGAPPSETKMKGDLASRFSTRSGRNSSPSSREVPGATVRPFLKK